MLIILFFLTSFSGKLNAQTIEEKYQPNPNTGGSNPPYQFDPIKKIRIAFHIVSWQDARGNVLSDENGVAYINRLVTHMNYLMANNSVPNPYSTAEFIPNSIQDTRIRFDLGDRIYYHKGPDVDLMCKYEYSYTDVQSSSYFQKLITDKPSQDKYWLNNTIHIFLIQRPNSHDATGGFALAIPHTSSQKLALVMLDPLDNFNAVWNDPTPPNYWHADEYAEKIIHEFGHAAGLGHINSTGLAYSCPGNYSSTYPTDVNSSGVPTTNNYMTYFPSDENSFSNCQIGTIHRNLSEKTASISRMRDAMVEDLRTKTTANEVVVNAYQTYNIDVPRYFTGGLRIKANAIVNISSLAHFTRGTGIIVEQGGTLNILPNADITNVVGDEWNGIKLLGYNSDICSPGTEASCYITGGKISNALLAIGTANEDGTDYGGWISVENCSFVNNKVAINIYAGPKYLNNYSTSLKYRIKNSTFLTNNLVSTNNAVPFKAFIQIQDVPKLNVYGCSFKNLTAEIGCTGATLANGKPGYWTNYRGIGIDAWSSGLSVGRSDVETAGNDGVNCPNPSGTRTIFEGLSEGVGSINYFEPEYSIKLWDCQFNSVRQPIFIEGGKNHKIMKNDINYVAAMRFDKFTLNQYFYVAPDQAFAIQLRKTYLADVMYNTINFPTTFTYMPNIKGLVFFDCDFNSPSTPAATDYLRVWNNTINHTSTGGTNVVGQWMLGDNRTLQMKCNTYTNLSNDWVISGNIDQQGTSSYGANNVWSSSIITNSNFTYYYNGGSPPSSSGSGTITSIPASTAPICSYRTNCMIYGTPNVEYPEGGTDPINVYDGLTPPPTGGKPKENNNNTNCYSAENKAKLDSITYYYYSENKNLAKQSKNIQYLHKNGSDCEKLLLDNILQKFTEKNYEALYNTKKSAETTCGNMANDLQNNSNPDNGLNKEITKTNEVAVFYVYPNPSQGMVNFNYSIANQDQKLKASIVIKNGLGQTVDFFELNQKNGQLNKNYSQLPSGDYHAILSLSNGISKSISFIISK